MTITIIFRNGKEVSVKCDSVLDFHEIIAIYRKISDEVEDE